MSLVVSIVIATIEAVVSIDLNLRSQDIQIFVLFHLSFNISRFKGPDETEIIVAS